jgi:hypothetical protein
MRKPRLRMLLPVASAFVVASMVVGGAAAGDGDHHKGDHRTGDGASSTAGRDSAGAEGSTAKSLCVGSGAGCFSTIQAAINAAEDGDTISIAPGTYSGGVTIDVSVKLAGAGAGQTVISGGGPVLTIGAYGASNEPTVSIDGVTITDGVTRSSPESKPFVGEEGVFALGGGVEIPPNADFTGGATVTITNSVITGNRVAPRTAVASGLPCPEDITITCIDGDLPFALAGGGGVDSWGTLTLAQTTVSNNRIGSAAGLGNLASDSNGGAILSWLAPLTITDSLISGNQTSADAPNGRFAEGGGLVMNGGSLNMSKSSVSDNQASLAATMPNDNPSGTDAHAGGIEISGDDHCADPSHCVQATIRNSTISGNTVTGGNSLGDANGFCGGICDDGQLTLADSVVSDNHVSVSVPAALTACACADSGGIGTGGIEMISNAQITANTVSAAAPAGTASATNGGGSAGNGLSISIDDSLIGGNHLTATTTTGTATVSGAGFGNGALLEIRDTTISDNSGAATGPTGTAQGGGISNILGPGGPPPGQITLTGSTIVHNMLSGSPGITIQGGGLYTTVPVTFRDTVIAKNIPDQCFGC